MRKIIPQSIKNIFHFFQALLANIWYGFPSRRLRVIGVTGTNGKTTTTQFAARILEETGYRVAVCSTINFKIADKEWVNDSKFTTLSPWKLQKFLKDAVAKNCNYAVLEVSSHSLDQYRIWGIDFCAAAITNITREHLDYHKTMDNYQKTKEKLFRNVSMNPTGAIVVNLTMRNFTDFLRYNAKKKYGYFIEGEMPKIEQERLSGDVEVFVAQNVEFKDDRSIFKINNTPFVINIPGMFNIENALAAVCLGISQGVELEASAEALRKIKGVPGRLEKIENDLGLEVIVDYAVTPDSLKKLYQLVKKIKDEKEGSKIIAVFGSCGERDRGKRPIMGKIVSEYADVAIVTNEDPYNEDPWQIINEVFEGVIIKSKKEGLNAFRILDRREAIKKALDLAKAGDIVVVTGKGAEETMAIGCKRIPWNDPKVIRELISESKTR